MLQRIIGLGDLLDQAAEAKVAGQFHAEGRLFAPPLILFNELVVPPVTVVVIVIVIVGIAVFIVNVVIIVIIVIVTVITVNISIGIGIAIVAIKSCVGVCIVAFFFRARYEDEALCS